MSDDHLQPETKTHAAGPVGETEAQREKRLARAKSFLDAGRSGVDLPPLTKMKGEVAAPDADDKTDATTADERLDPTRYGDWEKNGRCIDF